MPSPPKSVCLQSRSCVHDTLEGHFLVLTFTIAHFSVSDRKTRNKWKGDA